MPRKPDVFVGGTEIEAPSSPGRGPVTARAAAVGMRGGPPVGSPCRVQLKLKDDHPNIHLKTKAHWILGWVPPPAKKGQRRVFQAAYRWSHNGFIRYWGFVTFHGKRHYGWIDGLHFTTVRNERTQKPKPYGDYRAQVHDLMRAAWRYRKRTRKDDSNKIPVRMFYETRADEITLYKNRDDTRAENVAMTLTRKKKAAGIQVFVRWASKGWVLIKAPGDGHEWYFMKASYKDLVLRAPTDDLGKRVTQRLRPPPAWA